ncbi:MAG: two-component system sensor histidine kinase NtrB, partial [Persicimonas sp.]
MADDSASQAASTRDSSRYKAAHLKAIIESAVDGMITIDEEGTVHQFNPAAERIFGYEAEEVIGENVKMLMPSPDRERHDDYLERYHETSERRIMGIGREVEGLRKDGTTFPMELGVSEFWVDGQRFYSGVVRDISKRHQLREERERAREQLHQAQKMELIGSLTSGIAHDFNNLLTGIIGCTDAALDELAAEDPARSYVDEAKKAAHRGASLTRKLLSFARERAIEPDVVDLNAAVDDAQGLMRPLITTEIDFEVSTRNEPLWVRCDEGQLEQVLFNLILNARDAMESDGRIRVESRSVELDADPGCVLGQLEAGSY